MNVILLISQLGQLALTLGPLAVGVAMKIKSLLEVDPDFTVAIKNADGTAFTADDATMAEVNAWRASKGLPPLV